MPVDPHITKLLDAYRESAYNKDVDALTSIYDHDVRVFDAFEAWTHAGIDAWRGVVRGWFDSLGTGRTAVQFDDVQVASSEGLAIVSAFVTYRGLTTAGDELRAMTNRLTWALRRDDGGAWKVIHEHTSAPADPATNQVKLKR